MSSMGNNGNNLDLMVSVRPEFGKDEISADAWLQVQHLIDAVSSITMIEPYKEPTTVLVSDLVSVYKWSYQLCHMAMFLPIFSDIIDNDKVKIEDVPQFDKLMYRVMGE